MYNKSKVIIKRQIIIIIINCIFQKYIFNRQILNIWKIIFKIHSSLSNNIDNNNTDVYNKQNNLLIS